MTTSPPLLYLCEKPSQARDIAQVVGATSKREGYLEGPQCRVTWCLGHLLEMVMPEAYRPEWKTWQLETLPILPAQWQLAVRQPVAKQFAVIKRLLPQAREVIVATDADREGETIGREVLTQCDYRGRVSRLWLSALDETSIRKALNAIRPGQQTEPLYQAGLGRARADWLVGINLSRAYTLLGRSMGHDGVLTVGRVQTPTLKLVVDRDRRIENFQPIPFFNLHVQLQVEHGTFRAQWLPDPAIADAEGRCLDRAVAEEVAHLVQGATGLIQAAQTKRVKEPPPLPLDLSSLQQEGSHRWGMSATQTLAVAQALYETHKVITYPRTDCRYLPVSQWQEATRIVRAIAQADPVLAPLVQQADAGLRSRAWDDKKITAHHAIIPTGASIQVARLSGDEMRIYDLICRHYLAQFFPPFEYDHTVIDARIARHLFRASGRVSIAPGWQEVLRSQPPPRRKGQPDAPLAAPDGAQEPDQPPEQPLPLVKKGEPAQVKESQVAEKQTRPPDRFTEGTLIQAMKQVGKTVDNPRLKQILRETAGIGTEATRASIIDHLLKRQLLAKEGKKQVVSTHAGRMLVDLLPNSVTDPATTAVWEQALEDIAQGQGSLAAFQEKAVIWVTRLIGQVKIKAEGTVGGIPGPRVAVATGDSLPTCPRCGRPMRQRQSAQGAFWGCSGYPACREIRPDASGKGLGQVVQAGQNCPQCHTGQLVERTASRGKNRGSGFMGCSRYPACRFTQATGIKPP